MKNDQGLIVPPYTDEEASLLSKRRNYIRWRNILQQILEVTPGLTRDDYRKLLKLVWHEADYHSGYRSEYASNCQLENIEFVLWNCL